MRISRAGTWTSSRESRRAPRAFTFVELIVVLIVLGLSAALVFPKVDDLLLREPEPWRSARKLVRLAKYAHELAIATESAFVLHIDLETGRYWVAGKQTDSRPENAAGLQRLEGQLSDDVTITDVELPGGDRVSEHILTVEFSPEGWCDPVMVTITSSDGQVVKVAIDEWFGGMDLIGDRPAG